MATSGSVDFNLTSTQVISEAYRLAGVLALSASMSAPQGEQGMRALNLMLKTWGTNTRLWLKAEASLVLTATTQSYNLPLARRVLSVRSRTNSLDLPLTEISREEYFDLPNKASQGAPNTWFFDPQKSTTTRTLYIWPVASTATAASTTLRYTYQRVIEDIDALANDLDLPQEWLEAITFGLAVKLARYAGMPSADPSGFGELKAEAEMLLAVISADDDETAPVFFHPAF